jgi:hypothetical protein
MKHHEAAKSKTTTWLTPLPIIEALGNFNLDPCGYPKHQTADHVIHLPANGLAEPWHGRVWLNPPYGKGVDDWLAVMVGHGRGTALLPSRTETGWFQFAVARASAVLFLERRIAFLNPDGTPVDNNTVGSCFMSYGIYDREKLRNSGLAGWLVVQ